VTSPLSALPPPPWPTARQPRARGRGSCGPCGQPVGGRSVCVACGRAAVLAWVMWTMWTMWLKLIRLRDLRPCGRGFVVNVDMWAMSLQLTTPQIRTFCTGLAAQAQPCTRLYAYTVYFISLSISKHINHINHKAHFSSSQMWATHTSNRYPLLAHTLPTPVNLYAIM